MVTVKATVMVMATVTALVTAKVMVLIARLSARETAKEMALMARLSAKETGMAILTARLHPRETSRAKETETQSAAV